MRQSTSRKITRSFLTKRTLRRFDFNVQCAGGLGLHTFQLTTSRKPMRLRLLSPRLLAHLGRRSGCCALLALLPFARCCRSGAALGCALRHLPLGFIRIARRNIELCLPELSRRSASGSCDRALREPRHRAARDPARVVEPPAAARRGSSASRAASTSTRRWRAAKASSCSPRTSPRSRWAAACSRACTASISCTGRPRTRCWRTRSEPLPLRLRRPCASRKDDIRA